MTMNTDTKDATQIENSSPITAAPETVYISFSWFRYLASFLMIIIVILNYSNPYASVLMKSVLLAATIFTVYINLIKPLFIYKKALCLKAEGLENYSYPFATDNILIPWDNIKDIRYAESKVFFFTERVVTISLHNRDALVSQLHGLRLSKVNSYLRKENFGEVNIPLAHIAKYNQQTLIKKLEDYRAKALSVTH